MLDLKFISENAELVRKAIKDKHENANIDKILELDNQRKDLIQDVESKKAQRNKATSEIAKLKKSGQDASSLIGEMKKLGEEIAGLDDRRRDVENELKELLLTIPNIPDSDTPVGDSEDDNVEIRSWGRQPKFNFTPAPHWELGEKLGLFDLPAGAKISGSGFILYTGRGARLQRALINFMLDLHTNEHNYKEVSPPFMVTRQTMTGTGQLPKLEEDM
ncbi:MAG TPA: serine--tRNA ligase, partial [candidate division Zixibacteria bacterium]|nr:serine--tRNA ligase [candidate division Zixibacteria bacterium]